MSARIFSVQGLDRLPADVPWEEFAAAIVERPDGIEFLDLQQEEGRRLAGEYERGLAFGEFSELRWTRRAGGFHLVYLGENGRSLAGATHSAELIDAPQPTPQARVFLWGEKDREYDYYYESRIPRLLQYPGGAQAKRMAIEVRFYELDGVRLFRCLRLVGVEET